MKLDVILAGVGGQGILSMAAVVAGAVARRGWSVKQSEVHGMAQRGGAVVAHLRMAEGPVFSDLIPRGLADLIISLEPMESLRYLEYLRPGGTVVSAAEPVRNVDDYPDLDGLLAAIRATGSAVLVEMETLARRAGNPRTGNMVVVGAATPFLPSTGADLTAEITRTFADRGEMVVAANLKAFRLGVEAAMV